MINSAPATISTTDRNAVSHSDQEGKKVHGISPGNIVFDSAYLRVRALAPKQLLAMKLCAWRDDIDIDDARLLLRQLTGSKMDVWAQVEPHIVPGRELKAQYAFDDLWESEHGSE
jgi:hypothetical protein